ncbi:sulfite exporter TauE/SafE family protein [Polynucleobacter sp. AP-Jannik-300A-C4]|uniref:sulfite exporter TauE/SafE family protein n=2 Tax=Polynucleobacter TaxID=44013 RepID=UPI001BFDF5EE|nr:sulfite exporter TauE/SafE family protein [Polynucleobacter sp. AP-Jannik-300A-C4]QWE22973.1 sulfite exporter TauE/SafE family protein [Polynucleobacter sp. AP-Jannik-300A-C4]
MILSPEYIPHLTAAIGILVGVLMGLTGAGGGILSVPLLVFLLHLPISEAGPIALTAITLSAGVGAIIGLNTKVLRYKAAIFMAAFGLMLSPLGLWLAQRIPNAPLLIAFSGILMYVSIRMLFQVARTISGKVVKTVKPPPCQLNLSIGKLIWTVPCARALMFAGALAGFLSGLLGVGGGFILVPALNKFTDLPMKSIVATSLGVLAIVSAGGAFISLASGTLNTSIAIPFSIGSLIGLLIGKVLERKISGPRVQQIFAIFTLLIAISLFIKAVT